ncbi:hypothetical protein EPI10_030823 [Gossypium australe]|uniref:Uncharacterized protein n=1 Tax=Gossypium australe TaxID=47621 RepID=A0A5B6X1T1_9ROSI|nr:hypothetical protein EPI10_030823 [Gossypium australe]
MKEALTFRRANLASIKDSSMFSGCKCEYEGSYIGRLVEDGKNWRNGGMNGLKGDSREFGGIVKWKSIAPSRQRHVNDIQVLRGDTM